MAKLADDRVRDAIAQGGFKESELDDRGLVPVEIARDALAKRTSFTKGQSREINKIHVLTSDVLWAMLLSLEDGEEFVRVASRLRWDFHPRGHFNIDLFLRYGEAIVPWLATRVDKRGVIENTPWCVHPCLLACSSFEAFDLVWREKHEAGAAPSLLLQWMQRHPAIAAKCLVDHVVADRNDEKEEWGDANRARSMLDGMIARGEVAKVRSAVNSALKGTANKLKRATLLADLGIEGPPTARTVLSLLDAAAGRSISENKIYWPDDRDGAVGKFHALRAIAVRDENEWGLALERLEGDRAGGAFGARVVVHAFGSSTRSPDGKIRGLNVVPRALTSDAIAGAPTTTEAFHRWVSRRLADEATMSTLWGPTTECFAALGLSTNARVLACLTYMPIIRGALPHEIGAYQALARVIEHGWDQPSHEQC
jgi:hypothetical protein